MIEIKMKNGIELVEPIAVYGDWATIRIPGPEGHYSATHIPTGVCAAAFTVEKYADDMAQEFARSMPPFTAETWPSVQDYARELREWFLDKPHFVSSEGGN